MVPRTATAIDLDPAVAARQIKALAREAGFQRCGIAGIELGADEAYLRDWLANGLYGSMDWMARHGDKRSRPAELVPGTLRVVSVGLDYGRDEEEAWQTLSDGERAYVARYALGRDYEGMDDVLLVAVTEKRSPADVDKLAEVLAEVRA